MRRNCMVGTMLMISVVALLSSCATSPEVQARYRASEQQIAAILVQAAETPGLGAAQRCLSDLEFHDFRALDDQYILFQGRRGKQWINKLRMRCLDLEYATVLRVRSFSPMRVCELDTFYPGDWFDWPWYRRWPWRWGRWPSGMSCTLGKFHPVNDEQVLAIETAIRSR